ncbi:hypothetical protein SAMN05421856_10277 [Chryseobacterium taichungense]|uniref:Uncharacterized protein n=1 Tax=Chryseobacterium taichungense TaxID=295069 RepID=A0A1H7WYU4_9FLAO|nr:hypothetical protein [Chryseobacterium taichungense]SEM26454.1 hypothetical protein SAMN05421856_10277 [Chryseobacterium taichungense]
MHGSFKNTPLYQKAEEIHQTLRIITDLFPEDNMYLQTIKQQILGDIMLIQAKIRGAEAVKLYDIKMENAAIIRKAGKDILVSGNNLEMFGFADAKYYNLIRELIEDFRILFVDWLAGFNRKHFIVDDWGLFNPPGIAHDHIQNDDELDFLDEDDDEFN